MKKLLYLLFLLPFAIMTSCDKDDVQPFDMTLTLSNVTQVNGVFYAVSGQDVTIESLQVKGTGGKTTTANDVRFFLNDMPLFFNPWNINEPASFSTEGLPAGTYTIGVTGNLLQVDASIQNFVTNYTLVIVENEESLPDGAPALGSYSQTINFTN